MLEGLSKYWGFYIVAVPDVNGVGVSDLYLALEGVNKYNGWVPDISLLSSAERVNQNKTNSNIATRLIRKVLAARITVFKLFLQIAIRVDGELLEKHRRIWLLFQLSDYLNSQVRILHPFLQVTSKCLHGASDDALDILISRLADIQSEYFPKSNFIIGLDEAQQVARLYRKAFISSTNNKIYRTVFREVAATFTELRIVKLVVSGTGLSLEELQEAMASGVSKPSGPVEVFHQLGMFDTWQKLELLLDRYIPASVLKSSHSGRCLIRRMREYLLGRSVGLFLCSGPSLTNGRYRFSVSYLEYFLMNGLGSPHTLLNEYIRGHTGCFPGDRGDPFDLKEDDLRIVVKVKSFDWDKLLEGSYLRSSFFLF
jgi:hypothetical protein